MAENQTVKDRLLMFIEAKGLKVSAFERAVGLSNSYINNLKDTPRPKLLEKILLKFPDLNRVWLLTGEGEMLCGDAPSINIPHGTDYDLSTALAILRECVAQNRASQEHISKLLQVVQDLTQTIRDSGKLIIREEE